jgi:hypothetical protein
MFPRLLKVNNIYTTPLFEKKIFTYFVPNINKCLTYNYLTTNIQHKNNNKTLKNILEKMEIINYQNKLTEYIKSLYYYFFLSFY